MALTYASTEGSMESGMQPKRGLPAWTYGHPELTGLEFERIFKPSWQIVCHVNAIPKPGDYATLDLGSESIVVIRGQDGQIGAFHNVCRHRAARLLEGNGNCARAVTCPYHGWSYNLDGSLRGVTSRDSFPALDRGSLGLVAVRMEVMLGFVFVCLAGEPTPLAQAWAGFLPEFTPYRVDEMVPIGPLYLEDWDVDWKVAMDNYLESYHVPIGHPGLYRMFTPDYDDQLNLSTGVARGVGWMREQKSEKWSEYLYQGLVANVATDLPDENRRCWRFYSMLPNLGIDVFPDQMDFFQVLPRGPGKCTIRGATFGLPDARREMRVLRYLNARINRQVQREDESLCKRVQRGLESSSYQPGPLSELESCMAEFHDMIRARIPAVKNALPPKSIV